MNRRAFLKTALASWAAYSLSPLWAAHGIYAQNIPVLPGGALPPGFEWLYILHTNDLHSRIEPFGANNPKYEGQGGLSRLGTLIKQLRKQHTNTLLVDAGDVFQGTPYFNYFGGNLEYSIMSQLRYDATTLGNHDFDGGIEGLEKAMQNLNFPILNCNYDFTSSDLDHKILPYHRVQKGNLKIGIIGVGIRLKGLVSEVMSKGITYHEPTEIAQNLARELKRKGCHLVVCLSHLGFEYAHEGMLDDITFARKTRDIDVIIGGHTHTFMQKPLLLNNAAGRKVLIHQVGFAGLRLGVLPIAIHSETKEIHYAI